MPLYVVATAADTAFDGAVSCHANPTFQLFRQRIRRAYLRLKGFDAGGGLCAITSWTVRPKAIAPIPT